MGGPDAEGRGHGEEAQGPALIRWLPWLLLAGCGSNAPTEPAAPPVEMPEVSAGHNVASQGGGKVQLQFRQLSRLHRGYFSEPVAAQKLADDLAPCVSKEPAIDVWFDGEAHTGYIVMSSPFDTITCLPKRTSDGGVDFSPVTPVTRAIADWRDTVAAEHDIRVAAFRIGIRWPVPQGELIVWSSRISEVNGSSFSGCVHLNGVQHCVPGLTSKFEEHSVLRFANDDVMAAVRSVAKGG